MCLCISSSIVFVQYTLFLKHAAVSVELTGFAVVG